MEILLTKINSVREILINTKTVKSYEEDKVMNMNIINSIKDLGDKALEKLADIILDGNMIVAIASLFIMFVTLILIIIAFISLVRHLMGDFGLIIVMLIIVISFLYTVIKEARGE